MPIPGLQTLEFVPYRINLTPFAGLLSNGKPHTIALNVFNDADYFSVTASLLLFLDAGSTQVTGRVTQNTLTVPSPVVTQNLHGIATVTGTINVASNRSYTIAGFVNTSHGRVTTSIAQQQNFSGTQTIDFDTVNFTVLDQKTVVENNLASLTTVSSGAGTFVSQKDFAFPITVDFIYPVDSSPFGFTVATTQKYHTSEVDTQNGKVTYSALLNDSLQATDVTPSASSQQYTYVDSLGQSYNCQIASANAVLTSVSKGCGSNEQ